LQRAAFNKYIPTNKKSRSGWSVAAALEHGDPRDVWGIPHTTFRKLTRIKREPTKKDKLDVKRTLKRGAELAPQSVPIYRVPENNGVSVFVLPPNGLGRL
jgi:hypothetical protein